MNVERVEIYNLGALESIPGLGDYGLVRVPSHIRNQLNERARLIGMESGGIEIRFVTDAPIIDLYISALKPETTERGIVGVGSCMIQVYKGNYQVNIMEIEQGITKSYRIMTPQVFSQANKSMLFPGGFSPDVWRIVCDRGLFAFHGVDVHGHEIRPPKKDELPKCNWLAYGSSITNAHLDGYAHVAAKKLRIQVQNKGLSGCCQIEKAMVDYLLDECESDFLTCELGVNMRRIYTPEAFGERVAYLVKRLLEMKKPAVLISDFPNWNSTEYVVERSEVTKNEEAYEQILEKLVETSNCKTLAFVKGHDVLTDVCGLSSDLLHPTVYGHALMGINLAEKLKKFLNENGLM